MIDARSFIRSEPEIQSFNLNEKSFDFILLSSDGYTTPHRIHASTELRKQATANCAAIQATTLDSSVCLINPLTKFDEWYNNTDVFYQPFFDTYKTFAGLVNRKVNLRIYEDVVNAIKKSPTIQGAVQNIVTDIVKLDQNNESQNKDDITLIVSSFIYKLWDILFSFLFHISKYSFL